MRFADLLGSLLRRWYLTLAGLIITVGLCATALILVPPTYEAKASVVLLAPTASVEVGQNPYLDMGGLKPVVDVVIRPLSSQATLDQIDGAYPQSTYTVESDATTSGAILVVTANGPTEAVALGAMNAVLKLIPPTLADLQANIQIASSAQVTSHVVTVDTRADEVGKTRLRLAIGIFGAGLVGTVLVVGFVDNVLNRRHRRRRAVSKPASSHSGSLDATSSTQPSSTQVSSLSGTAELVAPPADARPVNNRRPGGPDPSTRPATRRRVTTRRAMNGGSNARSSSEV